MRLDRRASIILLAAGLLAVPALAQSVISARSGIIHYSLGEVKLRDQLVEPKFGQFPEMKKGDVLRTQEGNVEVLLTPGAFLRMGENSAVRMVNSSLSDTRLELVEGSALVEVAELLKDNAITISWKDTQVALRKIGLYRIDADPATLRVFDGEATVTAAGGTVEVKEARMLPLEGQMTLAKFDNKVGDTLYRWSKRRSGYLALANVSAAKSVLDSGSVWRTSGWFWNPYYGMYTFIPGNGILHSPFGYYYYAPRKVYAIYYQPVYSGPSAFAGDNRGASYNPALGYNTTSMRSASSVGSSSGSSGVSSAPASSSSTGVRGGDGGGGAARGGSSGGRGN